ncbi:MAG: hypothetical protein LC753_17135 [Acidobacteria bacterium]|nr:hypothetical protein [Acidobacteriota bacterium]MCA1651910.1 hypothetical protein [Acidobacteriota bacterium]
MRRARVLRVLCKDPLQDTGRLHLEFVAVWHAASRNRKQRQRIQRGRVLVIDEPLRDAPQRAAVGAVPLQPRRPRIVVEERPAGRNIGTFSIRGRRRGSRL